MKPNEVLVFKSPTNVDWRETRKNITKELEVENPNRPVSSYILAGDEIEYEIRKMVKKFGVPVVWSICQSLKDGRIVDVDGKLKVSK